MASVPSIPASPGRFGSDLLTLARTDGSLGHIWRRDPALLAGPDAARNLADVVHHMASLHGRQPSLVDLTAHGALLAPIYDRVAAAFMEERDYLARLVVAAGPLPGTPGQAYSQATSIGQHHALETLARSDRVGCACGAVTALLLDWAAIRPVLDTAAMRFGVASRPSHLPTPTTLAESIDAQDIASHHVRAIGFGARQFLLQHRGLWDLLEARAHARRDA